MREPMVVITFVWVRGYRLEASGIHVEIGERDWERRG